MSDTFRWSKSRAAPLLLPSIARPFTWCAVLACLSCGGVAAAQEPTLEPASMIVEASAATDVAVARQFELFIDFAVILQIEGDVSVIVLGNSEIADASVVAPGTIVLTGRAVGTTNVLVLGANGGVLSEIHIEVAGHKPGSVTVRRALLPSNYACTASSCRSSGFGSVDAVAAE